MKGIALCLFAFIPLLFALWKSEEIKEKRKMREGILQFLEEFYFQIKHFNRDQREILSSFENKALEKSGFLENLWRELEKDPLYAIKRGFEKNLPLFSFSKKSEDALETFSSNFGIQSKNRQLLELEQTIEILSETLKTEKTETENKIKMIQATGISAGLSILILLI